jgi:beta-phosphoglucomutase
MDYRAVLFDMDGVIVDSEPLHAKVYQQVLKRRGYEMTDEQYKTHILGRTDEAGLRHYVEAMGIPDDPSIILAEKAKAYPLYVADKLVPHQDVVELIRDLVKRGIALGLITGSLRVEAELTLRTLGIRDHFAVIVAAENITRSKPHPEGYLKGAAALKMEPKDCIVIEDAPSGVRAAKAAGMRCVAVTGGHSAEELQDAMVVIDWLQPGCLDRLTRLEESQADNLLQTADSLDV